MTISQQSIQDPHVPVSHNISRVNRNMISWGGVPIVRLPKKRKQEELFDLASLLETLHDLCEELKVLNVHERKEGSLCHPLKLRQKQLRHNIYLLSMQIKDRSEANKPLMMFVASSLQTVESGFLSLNQPDEVLEKHIGAISEEIYFGADIPNAADLTLCSDDLAEMYYALSKLKSGLKEIPLILREIRAKKAREFFRRKLDECRLRIKEHKSRSGHIPSTLYSEEEHLLWAMTVTIQELNLIKFARGEMPILH